MRTLILSIAFLLCGASLALAQDFQLAPMNPAFEARSRPSASYSEAASGPVSVARASRALQTQAAGQSRPLGYFPGPINPHVEKTASSSRALRAAPALPSAYDLRPLGRVTPVRDQLDCGSCWAFASMAVVESELTPSQSLDLSEDHLKNTNGYAIPPDPRDPNQEPSCSGGYFMMSMGYFARYGGPVLESDDPYNPHGSISPAGLKPRKLVREVNLIPARQSDLDNEAIKRAVHEHGAVGVSFYWNASYYKSSTYAYYYTGEISLDYSNHSVAIVGWDDNYAASNFLTPPPGPGAFIIKNSWGTYFGNHGYFYISYYDQRLSRDDWSIYTSRTANPPAFDHAYGHDSLGWMYGYGFGQSTGWLGANFTATQDRQAIEAVGTYTRVDGASYELFFYLDPPSDKPVSGQPAYTQTGMIPNAGFHAVKLDKPFRLSPGDRFSVVMKLTTPNEYYPIPVESQEVWSDGERSPQPEPALGSTFASLDGVTWSDLAEPEPVQYGSLYGTIRFIGCLKAYAIKPSTPLISNGLLLYRQ